MHSYQVPNFLAERDFINSLNKGNYIIRLCYHSRKPLWVGERSTVYHFVGGMAFRPATTISFGIVKVVKLTVNSNVGKRW